MFMPSLNKFSQATPVKLRCGGIITVLVLVQKFQHQKTFLKNDFFGAEGGVAFYPKPALHSSPHQHTVGIKSKEKTEFFSQSFQRLVLLHRTS